MYRFAHPNEIAARTKCQNSKVVLIIVFTYNNDFSVGFGQTAVC